ncbi:ChaN family lipoprotein [Primorskyibacter sp. S187A]|uniref:ChaN family lipoprotein n=1 Tax=Primorskyibacter sp. S187A TaxID=3415130 RepID=UPI003C79BFDA
MKHLLTILLFVSPLPLAAGFLTSDVVVLGEIHDNPHHHARQAELIAEIAPTAVVFEMLRPEEAELIDDTPRVEENMRVQAGEAEWSNMLDYLDVLLASPKIIGAALPREDVRRAFSESAAAVFGPDAQAYGLADAVAPDQLEIRKELQFMSHCEAMPLEMMGGMVEAQRLRDAAFARTVLEALNEFGAPVVLITGNGHARTDWGVPAFLEAARPEVSVHALGQGETGASLSAPFDAVEVWPTIERPDPCEAFK